jgi:hypothetical protein
MKITTRQLREIIKEEVEKAKARVLREGDEDMEITRFQIDELYEDPNGYATMLVLERHKTHLVIGHRFRRYDAEVKVIDGVEHIEMPFGNFNATYFAHDP